MAPSKNHTAVGKAYNLKKAADAPGLLVVTAATEKTAPALPVSTASNASLVLTVATLIYGDADDCAADNRPGQIFCYAHCIARAG